MPVRRALSTLGAVLVVATLSACGSSSDSQSLDLDPQVFVIGAEGGGLRQLTNVGWNSSPAWAPDGSRLAYISANPQRQTIEVVRLDGDERQTLLRRSYPVVGQASLAWSPNGRALAFLSFKETEVTVEVFDPAGSRPRLVDSFETNRIIDIGPAWSPDGERLAYARDMKVVVAGKGYRTSQRLTTGGAPEFDPRWSPVNDSVLFTSEEGHTFTLTVARQGGPVRALLGRLIDVRAEWSPDGRRIAFSGVTFSGDRRNHLYVVDNRESARPRRLTGPVQSARPTWSPDGRVAFAMYDGSVRTISPESGRQRSIVQMDQAEVLDLTWSPDGRWLAFTARKQPAEG